MERYRYYLPFVVASGSDEVQGLFSASRLRAWPGEFPAQEYGFTEHMYRFRAEHPRTVD
jgi:hypothetical protein